MAVWVIRSRPAGAAGKVESLDAKQQPIMVTLGCRRGSTASAAQFDPLPRPGLPDSPLPPSRGAPEDPGPDCPEPQDQRGRSPSEVQASAAVVILRFLGSGGGSSDAGLQIQAGDTRTIELVHDLPAVGD